MKKMIVNDYEIKPHADLNGAALDGANLQDAELSGANLINASLRCADLRNANLLYADLTNANLSYANLNWADLKGADISDADLSNANLKRSSVQDTKLYRTDLRYANIESVILNGAELVNVIGLYTFTAYDTSSRIVYCVEHKDTFMCKAGCFYGTLDDLEKEVRNTHNSDVYLANIEIMRKILKEANNDTC